MDSVQRPQITLTDAKLWGWPEILLSNVVGGSLSALSFGSCFAAVSFLIVGISKDSGPMLAAAGILGMVAVLPLYFIGFTCCNFYVVRLVKHYLKSKADARHEFICQLTCSPRLNDGVLGFLEDADDIGYFRIYDQHLEFEGLTILLSVSFRAVSRIQTSPPSYRAMWLTGESVTILVPGLERFTSFQFAVRSASTIVGMQRYASRLVDSTLSAIGQGESDNPPK